MKKKKKYGFRALLKKILFEIYNCWIIYEQNPSFHPYPSESQRIWVIC